MSVNVKYDFNKFMKDTFASFLTNDPNRSEFADELDNMGMVCVEKILSEDRWGIVAWKLTFVYDTTEYPRKPKSRSRHEYIDIIVDKDGVTIMPCYNRRVKHPRPLSDNVWQAANNVSKEIQKRLTKYIIVENREKER